MTIDSIRPSLDGDGQLLQTDEQIAAYLAALLDDEAQHISALNAQRLMSARSLAVSQLARQQAHTFNQSGNVLLRLGHQLGEYWQQHRHLSAALIFLAILLTFFAAQQLEVDTNLQAGDAFLLASDLPPEAYADKGFDTWLEANLN
jgi:hypothetical protein